jgi:hypothetical protein
MAERRDTMVLAMASHAARVRVKVREAKHKEARQAGHRTERYKKFKGRRHVALQEDLHARRARRSQAMLLWLEAQALVNAEEGSPREARGQADLVTTSRGAGETGFVPESGREEVPDKSQRLISFFFVVKR